MGPHFTWIYTTWLYANLRYLTLHEFTQPDEFMPRMTLHYTNLCMRHDLTRPDMNLLYTTWLYLTLKFMRPDITRIYLTLRIYANLIYVTWHYTNLRHDFTWIYPTWIYANLRYLTLHDWPDITWIYATWHYTNMTCDTNLHDLTLHKFTSDFSQWNRSPMDHSSWA